MQQGLEDFPGVLRVDIFVCMEMNCDVIAVHPESRQTSKDTAEKWLYPFLGRQETAICAQLRSNVKNNTAHAFF